MNYHEASEIEIADHFKNVSRQRMSQLIWNWRMFVCVASKMAVARDIVNEMNYKSKWGITKDLNSKTKKIWESMNSRCGNASGRNPAYADCTVDFMSRKHFALWAEKQYGFDLVGYELDKDILIKGNTVYSSETCLFVPQIVNALLVGGVSSRGRGSLPIGVCFNKINKTYVAQMKGGCPDKGYLGSFDTAVGAFNAYKSAKESYIKKVAEANKHLIDNRAYLALMNYTVEITD